MSKQLSGVITWIRTFLDDVYANINHTHSTDNISDENVSDYTEIYKHTLPSAPAKLTHDLYAIDNALSYKLDVSDVPTKTSDLTNDGEDGTNVFVSDDDSRLSDARTPTAHNHAISDVTNLQTNLSAKQDTLVSGTNIKTINNQSIVGSGNITIQTSGVIDDTVTQNSSNPVKSSGIYSALSNKANNTHSHSISDVTNLQSSLNGKADSTHSHSISDVTNLQSSLNDKVDEDTLLDLIYPIGSIYISANSSHSVCPIQTLLGGTWERIQDKFLLSSASQQGVGTTGGSADSVVVSHTHTQNSHTHGTGNSTYTKFYAGNVGIAPTASKKAHTNSSSGVYLIYTNDSGNITEITATGSAQPTINAPSNGESGVGANMPPYLVVNVWKRTA